MVTESRTTILIIDTAAPAEKDGSRRFLSFTKNSHPDALPGVENVIDYEGTFDASGGPL